MAAPPVPFPAVPLERPQFDAALRNVKIQVVRGENIQQEEAYLMNTHDPSQCYRRWGPKARTISLGEKGTLVECQVLTREDNGNGSNDTSVVFQESDKTVFVKEIRRDYIDPQLEEQRRGLREVNENPYCTMKWL